MWRLISARPSRILKQALKRLLRLVAECLWYQQRGSAEAITPQQWTGSTAWQKPPSTRSKGVPTSLKDSGLTELQTQGISPITAGLNAAWIATEVAKNEEDSLLMG